MIYRAAIAGKHYFACEECAEQIRRYSNAAILYSADWQGEKCEICQTESGGDKD